VIDALRAESSQLELIVVDDGSTDGSLEWLVEQPDLRVLLGPRRGAAAALNVGIAAARHPWVAQVDQDVIVGPGWLETLLERLQADPGLAAIQGEYRAAKRASVWARVMALDLLDRYDAMGAAPVDQVCTGNTLYRKSALLAVGLFDEQLGYGYDNDLSYRLLLHGFRLAHCRQAQAVHHWRSSLPDYLRQQFGVGYGRLDLIAKHRRRWSGDRVSGPGMILHAGLTLIAVCLALGALWPTPLSRTLGQAAALILAALAVERMGAGLRAFARHQDLCSLLFAPVHLLRDLAFASAIVSWCARRILKTPPSPSHSM
jgi:GT2 family glycosyltransferase